MAQRKGGGRRREAATRRRAEARPPGRAAQTRPGPLRPREGTVVGVARTAADGQQLEVEDETRQSWQIDCLGEPVELGARIRFEPRAGRGDRCGVLVGVLDPVRESWVCTVRRAGRSLVLVPFGGVDLPLAPLPEARTKGAREGDRVLVVPEDAPASKSKKSKGKGREKQRGGGPPPRRSNRSPAVRVAAVLGPAGDPDADHRALAWKHRLPETFSRRARLEADALPTALPAAELARRLDLRARPFVTIDPATARDHDDALFAEAIDGSERLWVAIADVSHFVPLGGFVDAEARRRGNSFYFPDRAIPMLPERLSSELCSLRPEADRLVLAVELRLTAAGEIAESRFHEAVIRSHARLSYEQAADWLASHPEEPREASGQQRDADGVVADEPAFGASLRRLARIAERLAAQRRMRGAIELDLPEVEVAVDAAGRPVDAVLRQRNPAHSLVEEAMLAANRAVAQALEQASRETLHRVHPAPDPRRLEALGLLVSRFGLAAADGLDEPGAIAAMLESAREVPSVERIHLATLRAMSQARYEPRSRGHFALQFPHYLHFTSPIRRYADLAVHRSLKQWLRGESRARREGDGTSAALEGLSIWLSGRERLAALAEREAVAFACCALLSGREGEVFEAEVTGVGVHGLFVRLERPAASGLVALARLDRRYRLDEEAEVLEDERSGRRIEIGTRLRVRLVHVDDDRGRLAFMLAGEPRAAATGQPDSASDPDAESDPDAASDPDAESASESVSHSA